MRLLLGVKTSSLSLLRRTIDVFAPLVRVMTWPSFQARPLATVVICGLITCTALTLLVLPAIYRWFEPAEESDE
jgi:Cu/Ag efflux pump CusA